ncbi:MAG TPA: hypothetical protein VF768_03240 [Holophagaceae bacterium]
MKPIRTLLLLIGTSIPMLAVPAWARKTGMACADCHAIPTLQLTATGLDFQRNGARMDPASADTTNQSLDTYASLTVDASAQAVKGVKPATQTAQPDIQLVSGGALSNRFSYTLMYHFNTGATPADGMEEAFIQYNLPLSKTAFLQIRGGQFNPELLRDFGLGAGSVLGAPAVLSTPMTATSPFTLDAAGRGLDVKLNWARLEVAAGVMDTLTSTTDANGASVSGPSPTNHKDTYASALYRFDDYASGIGLFRLDGQNPVLDPATPGQVLFTDNFYRNGVLARFIRDGWRLMGGYFEGQHQVSVDGTTTKNAGYFTQCDVNLSQAFGFFGRYDSVRPNKVDATLNQNVKTLGVTGFAFATAKTGGRWTLEASRTSFNNGITPNNDQLTGDFIVTF